MLYKIDPKQVKAAIDRGQRIRSKMALELIRLTIQQIKTMLAILIRPRLKARRENKKCNNIQEKAPAIC